MLARPLRLTFEALGGTFMKFGQMIASSPGLFGDEFSDEFRSCLDTGLPVPFSAVRERVEDDLGVMGFVEAVFFAEVLEDGLGLRPLALVLKGFAMGARLMAADSTA